MRFSATLKRPYSEHLDKTADVNFITARVRNLLTDGWFKKEIPSQNYMQLLIKIRI